MTGPMIGRHQAPWPEQLATIMDDIDPEIRDIVLALNEQGLKTMMSCAGHPGLSGRPGVRGYLWFDSHLDKIELVNRLEAFGLKEIKVEWDDENGKTTIASFTPIGSPKRFSDLGSLVFSLMLPGAS